MKTLINFLLVTFGIILLWDAFTTFYGTYSIFIDANFRFLIALIVAIVVMAFLLSTFYIYDQTDGEDFFGIVFRVLWFIALAFDLFTSFRGNSEFLMDKKPGGSQLVALVAITILVSGSPVLFSYLWDKKDNY